MRLIHHITTLCVLLLPCGAAMASSRALTLDERVRAQEAIDRVYYAHQIGASRPFEAVFTPDLLRRRVRTYLQEERALARFWRVSITDDMLRRELVRMASASRMPGRLEELYRALGRDTVLVKETLARPALVARLVRRFFARDARPGVRLDAAGRRARPWEEWWREVERELDDAVVATVATNDGPLPKPGRPVRGAADLDAANLGASNLDAAADACLPESWVNGSLDALPDGRRWHTAVWTGSLMLVWGGYSTSVLGTGGRYDPATDTWSPMTTISAPSPRTWHAAVWTGVEMVVWGGGYFTADNSGGRYDPVADLWRPTSTVNAPQGRLYPTMVWTGKRALVWGGETPDFNPTDTGGQYDPLTDSWTPISMISAPLPRYHHTAVWTGSRMLVWGGYSSIYEQTGGLYDPATNTWKTMSLADAPSGR